MPIDGHDGRMKHWKKASFAIKLLVLKDDRIHREQHYPLPLFIFFFNKEDLLSLSRKFTRLIYNYLVILCHCASEVNIKPLLLLKSTQFYQLRLSSHYIPTQITIILFCNYDYQGENFDINFLSDKATHCFHTIHIGQNTT